MTMRRPLRVLSTYGSWLGWYRSGKLARPYRRETWHEVHEGRAAPWYVVLIPIYHHVPVIVVGALKPNVLHPLSFSLGTLAFDPDLILFCEVLQGFLVCPGLFPHLLASDLHTLASVSAVILPKVQLSIHYVRALFNLILGPAYC